MSKTYNAAQKRAMGYHRLPFAYYRLPIAVQVIFRMLKSHVDKFARVDCEDKTIAYSRFDDATKQWVRTTMTEQEAKRIFMDLWPDGHHIYNDIH